MRLRASLHCAFKSTLMCFLKERCEFHNNPRNFVDFSTGRGVFPILTVGGLWILIQGAVKCMTLHLWAANLKRLGPCIAFGVSCHGDHSHRVCLIRACRTTGFSHTVHPVHCWVSCVNFVICRNCGSRRPLILTWMICLPGRPLGQTVADWFCGEPAPTGLASAVTSTPKREESPGLVSELVAQDLSEDNRFPEETAHWLSAVIKLWEPSQDQLSAVVRLSEPAPAWLDFTTE